ncbi:MAG TPA: hypothetical protein VGK99_18840 [Acidobacteriota bacterium]|jgi:hypothetical protein
MAFVLFLAMLVAYETMPYFSDFSMDEPEVLIKTNDEVCCGGDPPPPPPPPKGP